MRHRRMGTSGLSVSSLALGTMTWGRSTDFETASEQLRTFLSSGGSPSTPPMATPTAPRRSSSAGSSTRRWSATRSSSAPRRGSPGARHPRRRHVAVQPAQPARHLAGAARDRPRRPVAGVPPGATRPCRPRRSRRWSGHQHRPRPLRGGVQLLGMAERPCPDPAGAGSGAARRQRGGVLAAQPETWSRTRSALPRPRLRHPPVVAAGPGRAHREVPPRHPGRLARRVPRLPAVHGALLDDRSAGIVEALSIAAQGLGQRHRGRPGVGARPSRRGEPDRRRAHHRAAQDGARQRRLGAPGGTGGGPRRGVRPARRARGYRADASSSSSS